jgi:hypothetical protein
MKPVIKPITYSLQFRGQAVERAGALLKQSRAPGCSLVSSLTPAGIEARFVWAAGDEEALFESLLAFTGADRFEEQGTIVFACGHALHAHGEGRLAASADPHLSHGTVVWEVAGGEGQFDGASGRITSNFLLSDTGDVTEHHLGVIFAPSGTRDRP